MTCDEWAARLAKLQAAYDAYLTGVAEVAFEGKRIRYRDSVRDLTAELAKAQLMVDRCNGITGRTVLGIIPVTE